MLVPANAHLPMEHDDARANHPSSAMAPGTLMLDPASPNLRKWAKRAFWTANLLGPLSLLIGFVYIHFDSIGRPVEPASRGLDVVFRNLVVGAYVLLALLPALVTELMRTPKTWLYAVTSLIPLATFAIVLGSFVSVWIYG